MAPHRHFMHHQRPPGTTMTIIDRLLRPFRRRTSAPVEAPAPTKRDPAQPHSHSREIERNRRREQRLLDKNRKD
jgi:hypothetical protein